VDGLSDACLPVTFDNRGIGAGPHREIVKIGGGFGINRALVVPTDLSNFGDYPLIQALDIAASPSDPMEQLRSLGTYFPMEQGTFWFAAGLSFNSFALVDGIAVVAVSTRSVRNPGSTAMSRWKLWSRSPAATNSTTARAVSETTRACLSRRRVCPALAVRPPSGRLPLPP